MKKTITVPDNINDITLGQYQKYLVVSKDIDGEFLKQRTVEVFCNLAFHEAISMSYKDLDETYNHIYKILEDKGSFKNRFKIAGEEFGFIPDFQNITSGEYADLSSYMSNEQDLHKAMAVMFRPITETYKDKYDITPYKGTEHFAEIMKHSPLGCVFGAMVFFWTLAEDLVNGIQSSIKEEVMESLRQSTKHSVKGGGFTLISTRLQKEISEDLMKLLDMDCTSA